MPSSALILLIPSPASHLDLEQLCKCSPHAVLSSPYGPKATLATLTVARSQFEYEVRLRSRIDKLDETLRMIRAVERAKSIVMEDQRIEEDAAYHFLRSQAMAKRVSIGTVAAAVVARRQVLGDG